MRRSSAATSPTRPNSTSPGRSWGARCRQRRAHSSSTAACSPARLGWVGSARWRQMARPCSATRRSDHAASRSALTISLPLGRLPLQVALEVIDELAGMVHGAADALQGGGVVQPVGLGAQPAQSEAELAAAAGGLLLEQRLGVLAAPVVDRGLLALVGGRV